MKVVVGWYRKSFR